MEAIMRIQVLDWSKHFENNKSRERDQCSFVCVPNKQHGLGLTNILSEPDGAMIYGIWCLLIGLLSRQSKPRDGHLTDTGRADGRHLTGTELALLWRRKEEEITRAMTVVCSPKVGWAIDLDSRCQPCAQAVPAECPPSALEEKGREGNRIEQNLPPAVLKIVKHPTQKELALTTEIPPNLDTSDFRTAWEDWVNYRWEIKKQLSPMTIKQQMRDFGSIGPVEAVLRIRRSIANGWRGLFEPKGGTNGNSTGTTGSMFDAANTRRQQERSKEYYDPALERA
jgi:hypothetical protein